MGSNGISTSKLFRHPNGQITHCVIDDFTDPWKPSEIIVIQHGFARHHAFWYHWIPVLARKYIVVRRDTRGHGLSSTPKESYDLTTILEEIVDTFDQLGVEKVHFLGESTSGMLGEALAAKFPHRLHSLTICSSPSHLPRAALSLFAFGHDSWPAACINLGSRGWAEALAKVPGTVASSPEYQEWWISQIARSQAEGLARYAQFLSTLDVRPLLPDIRVKTLILAPSNSAATTVEEQRWIQDQIPGAELVIVNGSGHEIYVQEPEKCQEAFLNFLERLSLDRTAT